jgi:Holliday junction resolvasome RuvABC endonuclease subunit
MITIGIDPGKNGGIAVIDQKGDAYADKMPETLQDLFELLNSYSMGYDGNCRAYIEQVHSSPQMGVKSAFTFGNGFGHLEMALTACGIPFERIRPQAWQKALGCMTKGDKNVSKRRAQELFPTLKITHSTADALLIAEYGRRLK